MKKNSMAWARGWKNRLQMNRHLFRGAPKRMPALGKAKSHNWVEADLAFGDLGDLGAKKVNMNHHGQIQLLNLILENLDWRTLLVRRPILARERETTITTLSPLATKLGIPWLIPNKNCPNRPHSRFPPRCSSVSHQGFTSPEAIKKFSQQDEQELWIERWW